MGSEHKNILPFVLFLILACFSFSANVFAQKQGDIPSLNKEYEFLKEQTKEFQKFVKEERTAHRETLNKEMAEYRKFVEQERTKHQEFLESSIEVGGVIVTVLVTVFVTLFGYLGYKSLKDARENIKGYLEKKFKDYADENLKSRKEEIERTVKDARENIKGYLEKKFKDYADENLKSRKEEIERTVSHVTEKIIQEKSTFNKSMCFIIPASLKGKIEDDITNTEIDMLNKCGFKKVSIGAMGESCDKFDLLIFCYEDKKQEPDLISLLNSLKGTDKLLVIYAKEERVDSDLLKTHKWCNLANSPITLIHWVSVFAGFNK